MIDIVDVKNCPLCSSEAKKIFDRRVFRNYAVQNRICSNCGFVYQSPRMSDADLAVFYEAEYRLTYQDNSEPTPKDLFVQQGRAAEISKFLHKFLPGKVEPPIILDIGSSSGLLLERLREDFGFSVIGIEPGDAYRSFARRRGLEVVPGLEDLVQTEGNRFGLVCMLHVLEHLADPVVYLAGLHQDYLSDQGYLLLEVPNLYAHDTFEVAHMSAFSAHSLQQMLLKAGYTLLAMRLHGIPRSKILPLYITALAQVSHDDRTRMGVVPEERVMLKRRLGLLRRRVLERLLPGQAWLPIPKS